MLSIGTRVTLKNDSRYYNQCMNGNMQSYGTVVANKEGAQTEYMGESILHYSYLVKWDFESRAHLLYDDIDLKIVDLTNNEQAAQFLMVEEE